MDESAKQSCYNYLLWVLECGALAAYTSSPLPPVMLCVPSLFFRAHHTLLFTRPAFCVWERVWVWISGLIISDRDVTGVWQSSICHNWHLYPITFLVFFFYETYQMLASVVFPAGYAAVDWEFRGFRQGHSSSGRWREGRAIYTSSTGGKERKRRC